MKRTDNLKYYKSKEKELVLTYISTELDMLMQYTKSYSEMVEDKIMSIRGALELACLLHVISLDDFQHYKKFLDRVSLRYIIEQKLGL